MTAQSAHYRTLIPYHDTAHSQTTIAPRRFGKGHTGQGDGEQDVGKQSEGGEGKVQEDPVLPVIIWLILQVLHCSEFGFSYIMAQQ